MHSEGTTKKCILKKKKIKCLLNGGNQHLVLNSYKLGKCELVLLNLADRQVT